MCEAFQVEEFALMIRATRGRSRRPNHMHSHLDAIQTMSSVDFRQVAGDFHSVAEQASFYSRFRASFALQNEVQNRRKIDVWGVFFQVVFCIDFDTICNQQIKYLSTPRTFKIIDFLMGKLGFLRY